MLYYALKKKNQPPHKYIMLLPADTVGLSWRVGISKVFQKAYIYTYYSFYILLVF